MANALPLQEKATVNGVKLSYAKGEDGKGQVHADFPANDPSGISFIFLREGDKPAGVGPNGEKVTIPDNLVVNGVIVAFPENSIGLDSKDSLGNSRTVIVDTKGSTIDKTTSKYESIIQNNSREFEEIREPLNNIEFDQEGLGKKTGGRGMCIE